MVGGTIRRELIHRESFQSFGPQPSLATTRCSMHRREEVSLDNAFALIEGHPRWGPSWPKNANESRGLARLAVPLFHIRPAPNRPKLDFRDLLRSIDDWTEDSSPESQALSSMRFPPQSTFSGRAAPGP